MPPSPRVDLLEASARSIEAAVLDGALSPRQAWSLLAQCVVRTYRLDAQLEGTHEHRRNVYARAKIAARYHALHDSDDRAQAS